MRTGPARRLEALVERPGWPSRRRRCAASSPSSRRSGCSRTRTPRPAASRPSAATGSTPTAARARSSRGRRPFPLDLTAVRSEVEAALQATTEMLSQVTRLLALVSAPPLETATVRHVEVLLLQPRVVMVVVITSTGGVAKRVVDVRRPVDPGLADWADEYLNERVAGLRLGTHLLRRRLEDPGLSRARARVPRRARARRSSTWRRRRSSALRRRRGRPARRGAGRGARGVPAPARRCSRGAPRCSSSSATRSTRGGRSSASGTSSRPALHDVSLVGATYGLANRTLGAVSLLGPLRMDYDKAIRSVRAAAFELSRFVEEVYEED